MAEEVTKKEKKVYSLEDLKNKTITIGGKSYNVGFPTVGQYMEIQNRKMMLTNSTYSDQEDNKSSATAFNLNMVDATAHFQTLIPSLAKDLGKDTLFECDLLTMREVLRAFKNEFYPWFSEIEAALQEAL